MPTYEFRCPAGHTFDRFMKMSESVPELPCPDCGQTAQRQVSGGAGLVFKGSGFYLTDYGRNAHRTSGPASGAGASAGSDSKSGGESKSSGDKPSADAKRGGGDARPVSGGSSGSGTATPAKPASGSGSTGGGGTA